MAAYSAIVIAQALPAGSKLVTLEKDLQWWLVAKRFLFMANGSSSGLADKVDARWGDALQQLPSIGASSSSSIGRASTSAAGGAAGPGQQAAAGGQIDLLFLDAVPKEYLACEYVVVGFNGVPLNWFLST